MDSFDWADWIKTEREKQGLTPSQLAKRAGTNRQTIYTYENHLRVNPDPHIIQKISVALGYPAVHLLEIAGIIPHISSRSEQLPPTTESESLKSPSDNDLVRVLNEVVSTLTPDQIKTMIGEAIMLQDKNKKNLK